MLKSKKVELGILERRAIRNAVDLARVPEDMPRRRLYAWEVKALERVSAKIPEIK